MKNQLELLINMLFWEKYVDTISKENAEELIIEFCKVIQVTMPSVELVTNESAWIEMKTPLHFKLFSIKKITIQIF